MSEWTPEKMAFRKKTAPKRKPRRRRVMKQKNAYKPKQKKRFMRKRQPFVETKKAYQISTGSTGLICNPLYEPSDETAARYRVWANKNLSPIGNFLFMGRGTAINQYLGRDIYSKYLKQKIEVTLPHNTPADTTNPGSTPEANRPYHRITQPIQLWVVWGWIKRPAGTSTDLTDVDPTNQITNADVRHMIDQITDYGKNLIGDVNQRENKVDVDQSDFLTFKDRRKNIWTMKKRLLRPRSARSSVKVPDSAIGQFVYQTDFENPPGENPGEGHPAHVKSDWGDFTTSGYPNKLQTTISWKTNRKIRMAQVGADPTNGFAQDSWIPYSYLICPKEFQDAANKASPATYVYGSASGGDLRQYHDLVGEIKVTAAHCHWFSDS